MPSKPLSILDIKETAIEEIENTLKQLQNEYNEMEVPVQFMINHCDLDTAFEEAVETVKYHGIDKDKVNHTKKIAHLAFWITKLKPIYTLEKRSIFSMISDFLTENIGKISKFSNKLNITLPKGFNEEIDPDIFSQIRINEKIAISLFLSLYLANKSDISRDEKDNYMEKILSDDDVVETIKSIRYYNYSARSMAVMLEYFVGNFIQRVQENG